jgi:hypothetical protein
MAKTLLSIRDLQARALAEIKKQPGCSDIRDIAINRVTDARIGSNWSMCVSSAGAADANTAAGAALIVQRTLRHGYDLATD